MKLLLYPLRDLDAQGSEATDTFSLAIIKDYRAAGDLLISLLAEIMNDGDDLNHLVFKDLPFF